MAIPVGIDFGTSFSAVSFSVGDEARAVRHAGEKNFWCPSVLYYEKKRRNSSVGSRAEELADIKPEFGVKNIKKRLAGTFCLDGKTFTAQKTVQKIMKHLLEAVDKELQKYDGSYNEELSVAITVPAAFREKEKKMIRDAAAQVKLRSGRKITVCGVIAEPAAAVLGYFPIQTAKNDGIFVYDLGGGTFDAAVVRSTGDAETPYEILGQERAEFGGNDWDIKTCSLIQEKLKAVLLQKGIEESEVKEFLRLKKNEHQVKARKAKELLSTQEEVSIEVISCEGEVCTISITREEFEKKVKSLADHTVKIGLNLRKLVKQKYSETEIKHIILAGGCSRIPYIQKAVREAFRDCKGKVIVPENMAEGPDLAVSSGAARYAALLMKFRAPHSYGIVYGGVKENTNELVKVIYIFIRKGDKLPASKTVETMTQGENVRETVFQVMEIDDSVPEGEDYVQVSKGRELMEAVLVREDDYVEEGRSSRETLTLDAQGKLTIRSVDLVSGNFVEESINTGI